MGERTMTVAVAVALAVVFLLSGVSKMVAHPVSLEARNKLAVPATTWSLIGAAEIAGAAGVLVGLTIRPLGIAAATGLALLGLGAVGAHRRARDSLATAAPALLALALATAMIALFWSGR
jgi:uncharacterized membrane protein YphA (DoxX/SURF4 family)